LALRTAASESDLGIWDTCVTGVYIPQMYP
jgi:hypothetical protein